MLKKDEDALTCDLAETYGVFNMRSLPLTMVATLSAGLRENSRIMLSLSGGKIGLDTTLIASAVDRLSMLLWINSKDGQDGINRPESILNIINSKVPERDNLSFATGADFSAKLEKLKGMKNGY